MSLMLLLLLFPDCCCRVLCGSCGMLVLITHAVAHHTFQYIERMKVDILENLRHLAAAPGVGFEEVRVMVAPYCWVLCMSLNLQTLCESPRNLKLQAELQLHRRRVGMLPHHHQRLLLWAAATPAGIANPY